MRNIIYLHGFASSGNSIKGDFLREKYSNLAFTPSLKCHPESDILEIEGIIKHLNNPILVGSSLGGFYAEVLSKKYHLDALLINPLTHIEDMKPFIGRHSYFETGKNFEFTFTDYSYLLYLSDNLKNYKEGSEHREIIVAKDDKIIPYQKTINYYKHDNDNITIYENGGHSFNNLDVIEEHLEKLKIYS